MQPDALMLYKLIILYILDKVEFALTNAQLTDFILEKQYTNYFNVQQVLSDLLDDEFISCHAVRNSSYYQITAKGGETLSFFADTISRAIRDDIDTFLKENKVSLREENSVQADYYEAKKNEFITNLKVMERDSTIIEINLSVPSEAEAELICDNWRAKSSEVYATLFSSLMTDTE